MCSELIFFGHVGVKRLAQVGLLTLFTTCSSFVCVPAGVKRLAKMGMVEDAPGMSALDMNTAEDMIVRNTREVVPGMIICGMEVSSPISTMHTYHCIRGSGFTPEIALRFCLLGYGLCIKTK